MTSLGNIMNNIVTLEPLDICRAGVFALDSSVCVCVSVIVGYDPPHQGAGIAILVGVSG